MNTIRLAVAILIASNVAAVAGPKLEDYLPQNVSVPQGARVFRDGTTMLYDSSGYGRNVTPDEPRSAALTAPASEPTGVQTHLAGSWHRPAAAPDVIAKWLAKCKPEPYEDNEGISRIHWAAPNCDLTDPR